MFAFRQLELFQQKAQPLQAIISISAGCMMIGASFLPWLNDPLGEVYSACTNLPADIDRQVRTGSLSYGLLCLCCALSAFFIAYAQWKPFQGSNYVVQHRIFAGFLCLAPVALFLLQYLCVDRTEAAYLVHQKTEMLLVQQHLGYRLASQLIPLSPFTLDSSTLSGRLTVLVDQVSIGLLLPCVSAWIVIDSKRSVHPAISKKLGKFVRFVVMPVFALVLLGVLGRAPIGMICEYQAKTLLAEGSYEQALSWLDKATILNPTLNQVGYYHRERGEALYFLSPNSQSDDSHVYLAFKYRGQGDSLGAYQQLLAISQAQRNLPWVADEMSITLEQLAEHSGPLKVQSVVLEANPTGLRNDYTALQWLQLLLQVDAHNTYARYITGRIQYDLHNYSLCKAQMSIVLQLSPDADFQSSAYTYMALSEGWQGNYTEERTLLLRAIQLDPAYRNTTAREELSGLR